MKKVIAIMFSLFLLGGISVANAEVVLGVQGGWAHVDYSDEGSVSGENTGGDIGFGLYGQYLTETASGDAAGIHLGYSFYPSEVELKRRNLSVELDYDKKVFDLLGVYRWQNNLFLMAVISHAEYSNVEVAGTDLGLGSGDDTGFKLVAGLAVDSGKYVISPAVSYADYDRAAVVELQLGVGYQF